MKINANTHEVISNAGEQANFSIKANGKAFKGLIDGLYANKIQSITREIWSNAWDSHRMAGTPDRPFTVTFPTLFDPAFRVRDYGVSLTHDQVMRMYTTLFESTKEGSNDENGKWGLGSKAPFAYTDSFSVTVVRDGRKRFYAAMIGGDGVPTISYMGDAETDEEQGVEVAFPVHKSDVSAFQRAAQRVAVGFAVKPEVQGDAQSFRGWDEPTTKYGGDDWRLINTKLDGKSGAFAHMGCVLYPINLQAIDDLSPEARALLESSMILDFEIGELEITMSREELSYGRNDPTSAAIRTRVERIVAEVSARAEAEVAACKTYWEACSAFAVVVQDHTIPEPIRKIYRAKGRWQGRELVTAITMKRDRLRSMHGAMIMHLENKQFGRSTMSFRARDADLTVDAGKPLTILFEDMTGEGMKRASARVKRWMDAQLEKHRHGNQALWVRLMRRDQRLSIVHALMEEFDGAEVIDVAELDLPPKLYSPAPRRPVLPRVLKNGNWETRISLDPEVLDEGGFCVDLERMQPVMKGGNLYQLLAAMRKAGVLKEDDEVVGIPKSLSKHFDRSVWLNVYDVAKDWVAERAETLLEDAAHGDAVATVSTCSILSYFAHRAAGTSSPLIFQVLALREKAADAHVLDISRVHEVARWANATHLLKDGSVQDPMMDEYTTLIEALEAAYPMAFAMACFVTDNDKWVDLVTDYVNMCDNVSETNHAAPMSIAAE